MEERQLVIRLQAFRLQFGAAIDVGNTMLASNLIETQHILLERMEKVVQERQDRKTLRAVQDSAVLKSACDRSDD